MMDLASDPNIAMLEIATKTLGDLCDSLVFIGGCATGLLLTATRAHSIRATKDVDVVTKVATIRGYHTVENKLAQRGFQHDTSPDAPICRWIGAGVTHSLAGHLPGDAGSQSRLPVIIQRLRALAAL